MQDILLLLDILVPVLTVTIYLSKYKSVVFDHVTVFSFAFLYYWILPIFVGRICDFFEAENEGVFPPLQFWYSYFTQVDTNNIALYLGISLMFYLCFVCGGIYKRKDVQPSPRLFFSHKLGYNIISLTLLLILLWLVISLKDFLFTGYLVAGEVKGYYQGMLSSLELGFFSLYMTYNINHNYSNKGFFAVACNCYLIPYLVCSVLLLSMGGRLYVISTVVMILAYYTIHQKPLSYKNTFMYSLLFMLALGTIGVFRLGGETDVFFQDVIGNVLLESMLTSISLLTFIDFNAFEIFGEPWIFCSYLVDVLPRVLFDDLRQEFFVDVASLGYYYESPLGALNSFVSFMICFGVFGSSIVLFFFGLFMTWLKKQSESICQIMYSMLVGCIMFTFFRDPFSVSIIKNIIQNSIIIPILWMLLLFGFSRIKR